MRDGTIFRSSGYGFEKIVTIGPFATFGVESHGFSSHFCFVSVSAGFAARVFRVAGFRD